MWFLQYNHKKKKNTGISADHFKINLTKKMYFQRKQTKKIIIKISNNNHRI